MATENFVKFLHKVYGLFLDGSLAFPLLSKELLRQQREMSPPVSIIELDKKNYEIGSGNPNNKEERLMYHIASQGEVKQRNIDNGQNVCFFGNMCLVWIYQLWEDQFRQEIAIEIGYQNKNQLMLDIMGEIKRYRESIIHHKGKAIKEVERNTILKWFKKDEKINIDNEKMNNIIVAIMDELRALRKVEIMPKEKVLTKNIIPNPFALRSIFDIENHS